MKKIVFALALLAASGFYQAADAQIRVNVNIGAQPTWGPTGYDYAQYYYLPELDVYYDIQQKMYYYQNGNRWTGVTVLPSRYNRYNLFNTYKVVMNENTPWLRNQSNRQKYSSYRNRHDQGAIRDSRDSRYWENAGHPMHKQWQQQHNGNNNGNQRPQHDNVGNQRPQHDGGRPGNNGPQQGGRR